MAQASKNKDKDHVTCDALLMPVGIMAVAMAFFFAFQLSLVLKEREALNQAQANQNPIFMQSERLLGQFSGLVAGTKTLSEQGNKTVAPIVQRMREIGLLPPLPQEGDLSKAPVAAADDVISGPVKP
ncbi:MAG: hypothetical protein FWF24_03800 [Alphaproteobacteria bacterium]|nr:hypothetical protein [Alphaproteobacteria bacterium]